MKNLLKLEEIAIFLLCIFLFSKLNFAWWWFPALLLLPDIGMIGYVISNKIGAFTYNLTHHRLVATIVALYAITYGSDYWKLIAIILFAHIAFDRTLGYGLKYTDSFQNTHLGIIGEKKRDSN
ncbi:DUF4260 domain-containing protein [Sphingobacterium haloxyli]|uniref:DUF4260 domain-containing protein n=1 Tax=Sphingobacterium haloxyli TaxID=2100533 RepID=A0A2S9IUD7_9SPHI|nr:DUF4260 domain-containing protein [Sphingobacterium haloxyli]PRD44110.1 DUF4260 domain-containing protein [Sphingobacterium haloxyli]